MLQIIALISITIKASAYTMSSLQMIKTAFPSGFNFSKVQGCPVVYRNASSLSACSAICLANSICTGFQFTAANWTCKLLSYDLATPMPSSGSNWYYTYSLVGNAVDVARNKVATATSTIVEYVQAQTLVSGVTCGKVNKNCWYSNEMLSLPAVTIDLGSVFNIKRIIFTRYKRWSTFMSDIKIFIGNAGSTSDPIFGQIGTSHAYKTVVTGSASGRYIYIKRYTTYPTNSTNPFALCLVEAFDI